MRPIPSIGCSGGVFVSGHGGMVGSALVRKIESKFTYKCLTATRAELDLLDQRAVLEFFVKNSPSYVFVAAALVGGILENSTKPANFIYENLTVQNNLIHAAHLTGVQRLLFLGSSCVYPRDCPQPIREEYLLSGPLEPTNEPYAIAKISGIKLCESYNKQYGRQYISVMPTNLYGINDNYDLNTGHVLPGLIRKAHEAKVRGGTELVVWGTGKPRREFLHVDDLADACVHLMVSGYDGGLLNIGTGEDISIRDLARLVMRVVGFKGEIVFDVTKPDGTPRKLLDISRMRKLGWKPTIGLEEGIKLAYDSAPFRHAIS